MSAGTAIRSLLADAVTRGMAEAKMRMAIRHDAIGSKPDQPKKWIKRVDMTTATDPRVSAKTCRKIPCMFSLP